MVAFLLNPGGKKKTSRGRKSPCSKYLSSWKKRFFGSKGATQRVIRTVSRYRKSAHRAAMLRAHGTALRMERARARKAAAAKRREERAAAKAGPRYTYSRVGDNPGRRVRRARFNYKGRRRARNYSHWIPAYKNPYWVPSYAQNPSFGDLGSPTFWGGTASQVAPIVFGAVLNTLSTELWGKVLPSEWMTGWKKLVVSTVNGALLGVGSNLIAPKYSSAVMFGALTDVGIKAAGAYVVPQVKSALKLSGLADLADYLTPGDAAAARPLGYFGDYLTPGDAAAARPLGYTPNDEVIEGTATHELGLL